MCVIMLLLSMQKVVVVIIYIIIYSYVSMLCRFYFLLIELTIGSTKTNREDSSSNKEKINGSYILLELLWLF